MVHEINRLNVMGYKFSTKAGSAMALPFSYFIPPTPPQSQNRLIIDKHYCKSQCKNPNLCCCNIKSGHMTIERIKSRLNLLNKIILAYKEAEDSDIKDPVKLMERSLNERANFEVDKSSLKKPQD